MTEFFSIQEVLDAEPESPYRSAEPEQPKHALLSASASHRWLNCPPSARLEAGYPDQTSEYAKEGTLAHAYAENALRLVFGQIQLEEYHRIKKGLRKNPLFSEEMYQHIELYKTQIEFLYLKFGGEYIEFEKKLLLPNIPEGFGTADCIIRAGDTLIICDLKYGKGVEVSAEDNPQLKLYALGAMGGAKRIITVIIQPRLNNISSREYTREELLDWEREIAPTVQQAYKGEGEMQMGDWCRFCKHKNNCMKQIEEAFGCLDYPKPEEMNITLLTELLRKKPVIEDFLSGLEAFALAKVRDKGEYIPGYKLVRARTVRKYSDINAVTAAVLGAGLGEEAFKPKEPLSISQMEKVLGKARFNEILGDLVIKSEGESVLVPDTDKREEILTDNISVEDAFKNIGGLS